MGYREKISVRRSKRLQGKCNDSVVSSLGGPFYWTHNDDQISFFLARRDANNTNLSLQPSSRVRIISNINFPLQNFPAGIFALGTATLNNRSVVLRSTDSAKVMAVSTALYILRSTSVYCDQPLSYIVLLP